MNENEEFEFRLRMEREATASAPTEPDRSVPSTARVALQSAAKGAASIPDMFLGVPANMANLASAGIGYAAGELGRPDITARMPIIEAPAARQPVRTALETMGAIRPEFEPQTGGQRILGRALETAPSFALSPASGLKQLGTNLATGAASGLVAGAVKEATGSELAAGAAGLLTPFAVSGITRGGPIKMTGEVRKETLKEAQQVGYVIPPSSVKPTFATQRLESIAGKASLNQEASLLNQQVTNKLAARSLGLPENTAITEGVLSRVREQAGKVYERINALNPGGQLQGLQVKTIAERPTLPGPSTGLKVMESRGPSIPTGLRVSEMRDKAGNLVGLSTKVRSRGQEHGNLQGMIVKTTTRGQDIEGPLQRLKISVEEQRRANPLYELRQLRADANIYFKHYARSADPKSLRKANSLSQKADAIENEFEQLASKSGDQNLFNEFRQARTLIAKSYDVENALNIGDGNISARAIGRMLDQGKPLTGELQIIGKFAQAFPSVNREAALLTSPGVSGTDPAMAAVLGELGYGMTRSPAGLLAAGLPLLRGPARSAALSAPVQSRLLREPEAFKEVLFKGALAAQER